MGSFHLYTFAKEFSRNVSQTEHAWLAFFVP